MSSSEHAMPAAVQERLWREAEGGFAYAVLDGAQNENLLDVLYGPDAPAFECLFVGELEPDMASVAPYLVQLERGSAFTEWLLAHGWGLNWGLYLSSGLPLAAVWRHLRQFTKVYGPGGEPMWFRFYDPRVFIMFAPTCSAEQLAEFFGAVSSFVVENESRRAATICSLHQGRRMQEDVAVPQLP